MIGAGIDRNLGLSFDQLRQAGREAKSLGFESLWTPSGGVPDAFHTCAAWSLDTGLRTGIAVVPTARMWTPATLAVQGATLAELSGGRFVLGLGTGGVGAPFWASVGLPDRPLAVMRAYITSVRSLLAGETAQPRGLTLGPASASLPMGKLPDVPIYLGALGPQMLRLAGELADGVLLNWATPDRIAASRKLIAQGAERAGRDPAGVQMTMYIRVCVDDDIAAARQALGAQVMHYALARPGAPKTAGYRGMFAQMGFDGVLTDLEDRREAGAHVRDLVDAAPDELLRAAGYYGPAAGAVAAFARLSNGLDESVVRIVTARPGLEPVIEAMEALTPTAIRKAS